MEPASDSVGGEVLAAAYTPHDAQLALHRSTARFVTVCAGRRAGKTCAATAELLHRVWRQIGRDGAKPAMNAGPIFHRRPRRLYWVVAPTYQHLQEPMRYVMDYLPRTVLTMVRDERVAGWRAQERRLWLPGDVEIAFRSGEDPLALVGASLAGVWIDEVARIKREAWEFLRPTLTDSTGWLIATTTPLGRNWVWSELWRRGLDGDPLRDPEYASIGWPTSANPHVNVTELAQARRDLPAAVFRREYEASFAAFEGQIYPGVVGEDFAPLARYRQVVGGIDWGYASPGAAVVVGVRADGVYDVLDEAYAAGRPLPAWVETFRTLGAKWRVATWYADPSAPMLIAEVRRAGMRVLGADNDVWEGIQRVQTLLHGKRLRVHARCVNLLRELEGYAWARDRREGQLREEPALGQQDHLADALRYCCAMVARPAVFAPL